MLHIERINKFRVKPLPKDPVDESKIAAYDLFQRVACNIVMIGPTTCGKTTTLWNIIQKCINKKTNVIMFAACVNVDETYQQILEYLEKKKCVHSEFTEIYDDNEDEDGHPVGKPINMLTKIRKELEDNLSDDEGGPPIPEPKNPYKLSWGIEPVKPRPPPLSQEQKEKLKEKKPKGKKYPEIFMVFDDLGDQMRDRSVFRWLKESRQFKAKTAMLIHSPVNLEPQAVSQLQYILIFEGYSDDQIEALYEKIGFKLPFEQFLQAYKFCTQVKYQFMYIDRVNTQIRRNFDELLQFKAPEPITLKDG